MSHALPQLRTCLCCIALALGLLCTQAHATPRPGAAVPAGGQSRPLPATGDRWLDGRLTDIDLYAIRYPDAFAAELERYADAPRAYVSGLLAQPGWGGGDVWFACFLAQATGTGCRSVVQARTRAGAQAQWADVAAELGARPGSDAYLELRLSAADSYRRWSRPLQPDVAVTRALRKRAEAATPVAP